MGLRRRKTPDAATKRRFSARRASDPTGLDWSRINKSGLARDLRPSLGSFNSLILKNLEMLIQRMVTNIPFVTFFYDKYLDF